ncbi:uncharacterized protein LOC116690482 [Etheostoma spectabile]|uniref:uncharacterized protein LOC116690482 n=1 Tax=Etheostoma spectabile TaxID=54343 RepID=UPI0013AF31CE|nr:uncharacterized protein LOC116690482 [Etheostoma spectabile]
MSVPLVIFLSAVVLHSVSAGGVYCAKTARARAAALGLNYPGVHGAPDLYGPTHHGMPPSMMPFRPQPYNNYPQLVRTDSNMVPYRQSPPDVRSLYYRTHKQAHPRSWHRTYSSVQSDYTPNKVLGLPRGWSDINRKNNFEVKHVAPLTQAKAPGQPELVDWPPKVQNEHDFGVDESVPNRHGMFLNGMPQSRAHVAYQRGLTGYGLGRGAPALGSSGMINKGHVRAMRS